MRIAGAVGSRPLRVALAAIAALVASRGASAHAQAIDRRYAEPPTPGMALPTAPLAGEHDARAVVVNPGGLALVRGSELALALEVEDTAVATGAGQGLGAFWARSLGGRIVPRLGIGLGLEWLRPPRAALETDPGQPFRFTLGLAAPLGDAAGAGVAWHHFIAEGALAGVDSLDLGLSLRVGNHLAAGAAVRDLATRAVGGAPVERRYEAELAVRPLASDALEAAVGGRFGEIGHGVDGWARAALRIWRGGYLHAAVESRALRVIDSGGPLPLPPLPRDGRELRATLGIELSLGKTGATTLVTGLRDAAGRSHALGGEIVVRSSSAGPASVLGTPDHIERIDLAGSIGARGLTGLVVRLRAIARDPTAKAVVVTFDGVSSGWATLDELRGELVLLRAAGKLVFAYMVSGTGRDYYIASAANKIYLDPAGGLRLVGMAGTTMYFRGAFDQFGVIPQFEKIAEYKTAPEQFTEAGPTPVATRMRDDLLDSLWGRWVNAVADARRLTPAQVIALVDAGPYTAGALAADARLVDGVAAPDEISQLITREIGRNLPLDRPAADRPERWQRPGVAILYIDGDITDGKSRSLPIIGGSVAGGQTLIEALAAARADPRIGAIVLRIDSPGGSALASELIAREVFATRGIKPILCSMSDVAASGGYFVAAGCDLIFAEPMTITGSIGIFYGKFDIAGLARKLGVTTATSKRGRRADLESMFRPYTDDERGVLQGQLRYLYGRFVAAVAQGRGMAKEDVDAVGRGHVFTGAQAVPIKLVDRFGGLGDALDEARRRMGLAATAELQLFELPRPPASLLGAIGDLLGVAAQAAPGLTELSELPAARQLLQAVPISLLVAPGTPQARLPFDLSWE
jgi:protease-4